jgi:hypothetical protein
LHAPRGRGGAGGGAVERSPRSWGCVQRRCRTLRRPVLGLFGAVSARGALRRSTPRGGNGCGAILPTHPLNLLGIAALWGSRTIGETPEGRAEPPSRRELGSDAQARAMQTLRLGAGRPNPSLRRGDRQRHPRPLGGLAAWRETKATPRLPQPSRRDDRRDTRRSRQAAKPPRPRLRCLGRGDADPSPRSGTPKHRSARPAQKVPTTVRPMGLQPAWAHIGWAGSGGM